MIEPISMSNPRSQRCRVCGCTWDRACPGGCHWVERDLCSACAPGGHRDPRKTPHPGDILRAGTDQREVVDVMEGRVEYGFPGRAATRWLSKFEWQRWARNADVVKVAL